MDDTILKNDRIMICLLIRVFLGKRFLGRT